MKKTISILAVLVIISIQGYAQDIDNTKSNINTYVTQINEDATLELHDLETGCECGCGGLLGYYKDGSLVKLVDYYGHPTTSEITEFFYKDGELVYVKDEMEVFGFKVNENGEEIAFTESWFNGEYFFSEGKMIDKKHEGQFEEFVADDIDMVLTEISEDNVEAITVSKAQAVATN